MAAEPAKRKLTTILAADVVDYSRLMAADEEATLDALRAYLDAANDLVDRHNGRIFKTAGDAFLAEFGSPVEAVRCAISIQEDLAVRNREQPEDRQMWFRIGVNVGDVLIENDDLFGDGVNVAARLEGLAEKGGICISGSTFDYVKNKLSVAFDDIGAQSVKNIPYPVNAFRIVPGQVAVKESASAPQPGPGAAPAEPARRSRLGAGVGMGAIAVAVVVIGAYLAGLFPADRAPAPVTETPKAPVAAPAATPTRNQPAAAHPYDDRWKVSIASLKGCRDNTPRSYVVEAKGGAIDASHHRLPKSGSISTDGTYAVKVVDESGKLLGTHTAAITGDIGTGRFQGRKATCAGEITVTRLD